MSLENNVDTCGNAIRKFTQGSCDFAAKVGYGLLAVAPAPFVFLAILGSMAIDLMRYSREFSFFDRMELSVNMVCPDEANKYSQYRKKSNLDIRVVIPLVEGKVPFEEAILYPKHLSGEDIRELWECNCKAKQFLEYSDQFNVTDVTFLHKFGVNNLVAEEYRAVDNFSGQVISFLYKLGISPLEVRSKEHEDLVYRLEQASSFKSFKLSDNIGKINVLGTGEVGLVLFAEGRAWKLADDLSQEWNNYAGLKDTRNVITMIHFHIEDYFSPPGGGMIELEYIPGDSLENTLKKKGHLPQDTTLKYSSHILNGLIELRQAGIWYHRDIRPANIMIDSENDRAVLIDLGIASTDKAAGSQDNMRYGCPGDHANDLISLGQIMYKMVVGEHIFKDSETMDRTTHFKLDIRDERVRVYQDPENNLVPYFQKIDEAVKDERVNAMIKACLTAKFEDHEELQKMFEGIGR